MPVKGFYFVYGDDADMIEKKYLPDLEKQYGDATWLRYDATIDDIRIGHLTTEYNANDLFAESKVILIRNADAKFAQVEELATSLLENPIPANALVLISKSWNKTTKLGKLVKKSFTVKELSKPEIKPFELLDSLNFKKASRVIQQSNLLFENEYNPLALFSLISGHILLLKKIKQHQGKSAEVIAREIKQHVYRVKKTMPALREWSEEDIANALKEMQELDRRIRTWQYDEKMLIQMSLIKLCT
jgi:DNA polymerase III delta subunit